MVKKSRKGHGREASGQKPATETSQAVDLKTMAANDTTTEEMIPVEEAPAVQQVFEPTPDRVEPLSPEVIVAKDEKPANTRALGRQAWITAGKPKMSDFEIVYGTRKLSWIRIVAEGIKPAPEDFQATLVTKQAEKSTG
jgi:hypothetical protein